jgi:hypothetical protein
MNLSDPCCYIFFVLSYTCAPNIMLVDQPGHNKLHMCFCCMWILRWIFGYHLVLDCIIWMDGWICGWLDGLSACMDMTLVVSRIGDFCEGSFVLPHRGVQET